MKVIDLLNKIANGEIPKNIRYNYMFMTYDEEKQNYYDGFGSEIDWKYTIMEYINDEVEIIEEKEIPEKLELPDKFEIGGCNVRIGSLGFVPTESIVIDVALSKINDIIDYLKSKGE